MDRFNIYRNGELIEDDLAGEASTLGVEIVDERGALEFYSDLTGITGGVKRDGAGLLYVGDAAQGRYRARHVIDQAVIAAWRERYPNVPFGTPVVIAEAARALL